MIRSRAAFQTGTLAAFNENSTQASWSFGPDTGFVGGLPPEMVTLPKALKDFGDYATSYAGKWGLQGSAWTNTPLGAGYVSSVFTELILSRKICIDIFSHSYHVIIPGRIALLSEPQHGRL